MRAIVFFAVVCCLSQAAEQKCPANEHFEECGTACPTTCENRNSGPRPCILICKQGCFCDKGFVRSSKGDCVRAEDCGKKSKVPLMPSNKCGKNQEFLTCGTACPDTCENRNSKPMACTYQCVIGCQCKKGFFKDGRGNCVTEAECDDRQKSRPPFPAKMTCSGANEVFTQCGARCQPKCNARQPQICPAICAPGCTCKSGFFRDNKGKCVKKEDCPRAVFPIGCVGRNQVFRECGSPCEAACGKPVPLACPAMCKRGCFCARGFVRDANGQCVKPEDCPSKGADKRETCSKANEAFSPCAAHCELKCGDKEPKMCNRMCVPGCACKTGFYRAANGECVRKGNCPSVGKRVRLPTTGDCEEGESFSPCSAHCEARCGARQPQICNRMCVPGCACKQGLFRISGGKCVPEDQCPA